MVEASFILSAVPASAPILGRYANPTPLNGNGGNGYFSVVFAALDTVRDRKVALKFFVSNGDPYRELAFQREGELTQTVLKDEPLFTQTVRGVEHFKFPVNVPSLGSLEIDMPFIAFEWMPNGSGDALCAPPGTLGGLVRRLQLFSGMVRCVSRAHFLQIAHRDLKPGNFLLGPANTVKLADFGTARLVVPGTPSLLQKYSAPPGDLRYTAPEALAGLSVEPATARLADVYSLGAILFELLTGQPLYPHILNNQVAQFVLPFRHVPDSNRRALFESYIEQVHWPIPKIRSINPNIPRRVHTALDDLIAELTRPDFRARPRAMEYIHRRLKICWYQINEERRNLAKLRRRHLVARQHQHQHSMQPSQLGGANA